jgi:hypothetical protein
VTEATSTARGSRFWTVSLRVMYAFLRFIDPLVRSWLAHGFGGLDGVVEVRIPGRRSGRPRSALVTILSHDGHWYVGHPNGNVAWTRNAEAAGRIEIEPPAGIGSYFDVVRLPVGPERDAVIRATRVQQPFPGNLVYRAAARHIRAIGVYFRLAPVAGPEPEPQPEIHA